MDTMYSEPFIQATFTIFRMMLEVQLEDSEMQVKDEVASSYEVSAFIGITGSCTGGVVLSFPEKVACAVASKLLGEDLQEVNTEVTDAIGELANIISGNACLGLGDYGFKNLTLSLPHAVVGKHHTVWRSKDLPYLAKRFFISDVGPFCLEINIRQSSIEME